MKVSINVFQFRDAFASSHFRYNFTYDGLTALFNYIEDLDAELGVETELDAPELACTYTEWANIQEFQKQYPDIAKEDIQDHTIFIDIDGTRFITSQF